MLLEDALAISVGAVAGSLLRYSVYSSKHFNSPRATLAVNVLGGLLMGGMAHDPSPRRRLIMCTGFCASFTTFATFSLDVVKSATVAEASKQILANNVATIAACGTTYFAVGRILRRGR